MSAYNVFNIPLLATAFHSQRNDWVSDRVAKCHGYGIYNIRVKKILASCGKSLGGHTILQNEASFGGNLHNLCQIWLEGFTRVKTLTFCNSGERPP